jgi:hypothetical protein
MADAVRFPDIPLYRGWGVPMRAESEIKGLEIIQGELPEGLEGTLYKVGADRQYPSGRTDDIFIDGEGMIHMFRIEDGQVDYRSRWVRTDRFKLQEKARRSLFGRYRNRHTNDPSVEGEHMGTANTTAMFHAGRLYALKEDDLPYEMDPDTLETLRKTDFDGAISSVSFTAHPKVDPITDELLGFAYQAKGDASRDIVYYLFDKDRQLINEVWFEMPYAACVHDFAITEDVVPLAARDDGGHVIYLRSLTKSVSPAVRVAGVIARGPARERILAGAQSESMYVSGILQAVALDVVTQPAWRTHLRGLRRQLASRRDLLLGALREHAPAARVDAVPQGGLNLWARLPDATDVGRLVRDCEAAGVVVAGGDEWFPAEPAGAYLRLNYSGPNPGAFPEGARILGEMLTRQT